MQVQVHIEDSLWEEFVKLGEKSESVERITQEAIKSHIKKLKAYKKLLSLEGNAHWDGNLNDLRGNRV